VGAARSIDPHERLSFSNFGSRVDCYAWGENIVTTGWSAANPAATDTYWGINGERFFGGTSGASPIIVSVCLLVQSLRGILTPTSGKGLLGPFRMRQMLSDPLNGTASFTVTDRIGSMPSLALIIANEFQP
jgi:serine protease